MATTQLSLDLVAEVERHKDDLIQKVESFFTNRKPAPVTTTQLSNLLRLASETTSTKEVLSFIRYQIGREPKWRKDNFGERLIRTLEGEVLSLHNDKRVKIRLMRLFLGYLRRQDVYLRG
jgi:hypothetical protein